MTAPEEKLVAVAGANGRLGRLVVAALLEQPGVRVRALVRDAGAAGGLAGERVEVRPVDLRVSDERLAAMDGARAVVSTLQGGPDVIIDGQLALLSAARAAGVRRFLPSDYSYNFFTLPEGININSDWRRAFAARAEDVSGRRVEVVHLLQGIFASPYVLGFLGMLDEPAGVIRFWGDGRTPIDWTTWEDTARYAAAAATDPRPVPRRLYVAGDRQDVHGFARAWEAARGRAPTIERLGSLEALEATTKARHREAPDDMYAWLPLMYARGVFGGQALLGPLENARYPHIRPESLEDALRRGAR